MKYSEKKIYSLGGSLCSHAEMYYFCAQMIITDLTDAKNDGLPEQEAERMLLASFASLGDQKFASLAKFCEIVCTLNQQYDEHREAIEEAIKQAEDAIDKEGFDEMMDKLFNGGCEDE